MQLGKIGVWTWLDVLSASESADFARHIESLGYSALWVPEAIGRDPFALCAHLAAATERLVLATGIANIYARDPMAMRAAQETLAELSGGRFVLGLGVSHAPMVQGVRGHDYGKPVSTMRGYLELMGKATFAGRRADEPAPIVIGALREKMLGLAASATAGAHPYFVTPEHTRRAREILGDGPILAPEQKVLLETDPEKARAVGRANMQMYLQLPNYQNNLRWLGYGDEDFADGGSERLVDAIVAWGDAEAIQKRIAEHHAAGADHVCIQPLRPDGVPGPHIEALEQLAPGT
jgi:probable F420-dependent oxidoreductase